MQFTITYLKKIIDPLNRFYIKYKPTLLFITLLACMFFTIKFLEYDKNFPTRPRSVHSWAQCMRASIAKNYAEESMNFFLPRLHNYLDGEGITGLEFPLVNYIVAILYKLFGFNEAYYRGFMCFTMFLGLFYFFKLHNNLLNNVFLSLLSVSLAFFSPVLVYYTTNFMPDVTSLALVLIGWYLFFDYLKTTRVQKLYWLVLVLTIASLIKVTSFIAFGVLFCVLILDHFKFYHKTTNGEFLIKHKKQFIIASVLGTMIIFGWYYYAQWLSEKYHSNAFTLGSVYPKTEEEFWSVVEAIKNNWYTEYYRPEFYNILFYMLIAVVVLFKYTSRLLFSILFFTTLGSLAFTFLMFIQFKNHDYYIIPLLPSVFLLLLTFFDTINRLFTKKVLVVKYVVAVVLCVIMFDNAVYAREHYIYRQSEYYLDTTGDDFRMYYDLEPKLREWGIKKEDLTLIGKDYTYCNSLYLSNQRGFVFNEYDANYISAVFTLKPRVLILNDTAQFNKVYSNDFKNKIVGVHKNLIIYKLY